MEKEGTDKTLKGKRFCLGKKIIHFCCKIIDQKLQCIAKVNVVIYETSKYWNNNKKKKNDNHHHCIKK